MAFNDDVQTEVDKLILAYEKENGEMTPEELADKKLKLFIPKAKQIIKRKAHEANVAILVEFAKKYASSDQEPEVMAAVTAITTVTKGTRTVTTKNGKATPRTVIDTLFAKIGDVVTEGDVFNRYKMGRGEMKSAIKISLQKALPDERKWVKFDVETETYKLVDMGATPPVGWTGYVPITEAAKK